MNSNIIRNTNILGNAYTNRYDGLIITYNTLHSYNYILWFIHSKVADWNTILNSGNKLINALKLCYCLESEGDKWGRETELIKFLFNKLHN